MHRITCTVFFEDPFWVGVWERESDGRYSAAKATFGAEPSDAQVLEFVQHSYVGLAFSKPSAQRQRQAAAQNPKRVQREAARAVLATGVGTKAQQALKSQYEAGKEAHKALSREERLAANERKFLLHQEKRKAKHRGH
jgi:hypothetical protein